MQPVAHVLDWYTSRVAWCRTNGYDATDYAYAFYVYGEMLR